MSEAFCLTRGNLLNDGIPPAARALAEAISRKHGEVVFSREKHGLHLNFASPGALDKDGRKELRSRHCSLNVSKYLYLDQYAGKEGTYNNDSCAVCMKYSIPYTVSGLLKYAPLDRRGILDAPTGIRQKNLDRSRYLERDENGILIPMSPGECVSLLELPPNHIAIQYLKTRGYSIESLVKQFNCEFCIRENPKGFYVPKAHGFKNTPQERIIFWGMMEGVRKIWQARIIDRTTPFNGFSLKEYWHPYQQKFVAYEIKRAGDKKFSPLSSVVDWEDEDDRRRAEISKYMLALGSERSQTLIGFDSAVKFNVNKFNKFIILCEGPLDAAAIGPPACAIMGKFLSNFQVDLVVNNFNTVVLAFDNDEAGKDCTIKSHRSLLEKKAKVILFPIPAKYKDIGEMPCKEIESILFNLPVDT